MNNSFQSINYTIKLPSEIESCVENISSHFPDPNSIKLGISEMLINAIEHGNANISFQEKNKLLKIGLLASKIDTRLTNNKKVAISLTLQKDHLNLSIKDEGTGFNYKQYNQLTSSKSLNGRGIFLAKQCFDGIYYIEPGNEVMLIKKLN